MRSLVLTTVTMVAFVIGVTFAACGGNPPPTSTTPPTPGSAVILPSPVTAETVPKSTPSVTPSASASQ